MAKVGEAPLRFWRREETAAAPTLAGWRRFPYGPFRFEVHLAKGAEYAVQASNDFQNWSQLAKDIARGPTVEYVDSEAFKFNYRYYRVMAKNVPSDNVIGYASTTLPPGFSMIANPFTGQGDSVEEIFHGWAEGTTLSRFDTRLFKMAENAVQHGKWTNPTERLVPGEGAMFFNPSSDYKSTSFVGEVSQGHLSVPIPAGFSIRSSLLPQFGHLQEELGFPVAEGDVIHIFDRDRQKYVLYPFEDGKWTSGAPVVSLCESFWVAKKDAANWRRTILINP
jgi:hypothetical protein